MRELRRLMAVGAAFSCLSGEDTSFPVGPTLFRFVRRGDLGRLLVTLALVALRKLEFAALRKGVGSERNIRCEYGTAPAGSSCCAPSRDI